MSRHLVQNPVASMAELVAMVGQLSKPREDWRLINPAVYGAINGLPGSAGVAVATNGVLVVIVRETGPFLGHVESFIPFEDETEPLPSGLVGVTRAVPTSGGRGRKQQNNVDIGEFV